MAVNLGTRGVIEAIELVEYCNLPGIRNYQRARLIAYVDDDHCARLSSVPSWNTRQVEFGVSRLRLASLAAVLALTGACAVDPATPPDAAPSAVGSRAGRFTNPVHAGNFPDPGVIEADRTWYAYGTNGEGANVPVLTSTDLVTWEPGADALPEVGRWATAGDTWAPEAVRTAAGGYVLYYTARSTAVDLQCVGAATAGDPRGPFVDRSAEPLLCQAGLGGSIDASPYLHDGRLYLYWKNDGNRIGAPTHLYGQALAGDGLAVTGPAVRLLASSRAWQGTVIEAPQMVRHADRLYLMYSANASDSDAYAVGYAVCPAPLTPCVDAAENPILASSPAAAGPGHSYLVTGPDGGTWLLYHAWPPDAVGSVSPGRQLWLDRVDWLDGRPVVRGPTARPQPRP